MRDKTIKRLFSLSLILMMLVLCIPAPLLVQSDDGEWWTGDEQYDESNDPTKRETTDDGQTHNNYDYNPADYQSYTGPAVSVTGSPISTIDYSIGIPANYWSACPEKGQLIADTYGGKNMKVYLPYCYSQQVKCNLMIFEPGIYDGCDHAINWPGTSASFVNVLDNMIYNQELAPTVYVAIDGKTADWLYKNGEGLVNYLQGKYFVDTSTSATAIGGWSYGSMDVIRMLGNSDAWKKFGYIDIQSGYASTGWAETKIKAKKPSETEARPFGDLQIYCVAGTADNTCIGWLNDAIANAGACSFKTQSVQGASHAGTWQAQYCYNFLRTVFPRNKGAALPTNNNTALGSNNDAFLNVKDVATVSGYINAASANVNLKGVQISGIVATTRAGGSIPVYNGIPSEWNATANSDFIILDNMRSEWDNWMQATFGEPYTNGHIRQFSLDNVDKPLSTARPYTVTDNGSGTFLADGVVCQSFCPWPYLTDGKIHWQNTGDASGAHQYKWCAIMKNNTDGTFVFVPMIPTSGKGHTWPGGVMQTCINHSNDGTVYCYSTGGSDWAQHNHSTAADAYTNVFKTYLAWSYGGNQVFVRNNPQYAAQDGLEGYSLQNNFGLKGYTLYGILRVR